MSHEELVDEFIAWQRNHRGRTHDSMRMYSSILHAYFNAGLGLSPTIEQLESFKTRWRYGGRAGSVGGAPADATMARDVTVLRSFFQYLMARGYVEDDPTVLLHAASPKNKQPRPISDEIYRAWWAAPLPPDLRSILGLGYWGGLRRSELARLDEQHIEFDPLRVRNLQRKGGNEDVLPLAMAISALRKSGTTSHLAPDEGELELTLKQSMGSGLILSWLVSYKENRRPDEIGRVFDRARRHLKLPRFTPHQLRHSCATNLLRAGVPLGIVSAYMNHQSIDTTLRYAKLAGADPLSEWLQH